MMTIPYTPIVINTGSKLVVMDTGTGEANFDRSKGVGGQFHSNLKAVGHRSQRGRYWSSSRTSTAITSTA